ncbi:serine hydrolase [Telluribacter sp. SYSU D00476]|uniref:serine hydrolase n=1 Tax=Telluribacter sp. SYSU D00476 TaxID=2811430 RepID=UPI001FF5BBBB|nr:serine hydrolase [Telluribacter sp. SYSU D00476]
MSSKLISPYHGHVMATSPKQTYPTLYLWAFLLSFFVYMTSTPAAAQPQTDAFLEKLLRKYPERFDKILADPVRYDVQILYTKIDRNKKNEPSFTTYRYHVDPSRYFYPASTVKLPAVLLALEKLNKLNVPGLDKYAPMLTEAARPEQTAALEDTTAENGLPSVAHYARKILLVSDNDAFNRLYEFIGQQAFNDSMQAKGYTNTRITHRLQLPMSTENNRYTNPVRFVKDGEVLYEQPMMQSSKTYVATEPILRGKGYMRGETLVNEPFDFREKNFFALEDQHELMKAIMFPESVEPRRRFNLKEDDYEFMYRYMSQLPIETSYPEHYSEDYHDSYGKFLLFGASKRRAPRHIRSFNKVGDAYGYLLDNAYIVDFERGIEFLLTAVIYCNEDQILNDDHYEYESVGLPFMADLGKTIFEYEVQRKRRGRPDLSRYEVEYDK